MRRIFPTILVVLLPAIGCGEVPYAPHPPGEDAGAPIDGGTEDAAGDGGAGDGGETGAPLGPLPTSSECISCARTPCFTPGRACLNDPVCVACFNDNRDAPCATNPTWLALLACACEPPTTCAEACATTCATRP